MAKTLKIWNGIVNGGEYKRWHFFVAAYTIKQCAELASLAATDGINSDFIRPQDIKGYFHADAWGNSMNEITPTEPCVYATYNNEKPLRIL